MSERRPQSGEDERFPPIDRQAVSDLAARSDDPEVRARWAEALLKWGDAFLAFAKLGVPELHTDDVERSFGDLYVGSFDNLRTAIDAQLDALGWAVALERLRRDEFITGDELDWNYAALTRRMEDVFDVIELGGRVHLFAK